MADEKLTRLDVMHKGQEPGEDLLREAEVSAQIRAERYERADERTRPVQIAVSITIPPATPTGSRLLPAGPTSGLPSLASRAIVGPPRSTCSASTRPQTFALSPSNRSKPVLVNTLGRYRVVPAP